MPRQGLMAASGVVLARTRMGESGLWLTLFLKGEGLLRASAPGAESGHVRFGGGTEPFVWGTFQLHKGRAGGICLSGVDIADDMLPLRKRPRALYMAVRWARLIKRFLPSDYPADTLLANLYWNMRLLSAPSVPPAAAEWRFLWRWLEDWGLAPDLNRCARCGRVPDVPDRVMWTEDGLLCADCGQNTQGSRPSFTGKELGLLLRTAARDGESVARAFEKDESLKKNEALFALAARCAEGLLYEK
ncbi:MAG: DNA repair protein RecO [Fretibacterium sp.]|nr:DNA repair protein RecO [Fretibacterium sp.]